MIAEIRATDFIKPLRSGRTCPLLMRCEQTTEEVVEAVVKLRAGGESSTTGLICELLAAVLGRDLGLPVPEPYLVMIDPYLHQGMADTSIAKRVQASAGLNFGSRHLGPAYVSWPQLRSVPAVLLQTAAEIFAFDLLIQNPDRRVEKPNLLRKADDLAIIDHEMAFSFLFTLAQGEYPWEGKGIEFARDHVFYGGLKGNELSWDRLSGALEAIDKKRITAYMNALPTPWREESGDAADRIRDYLELAVKNREALFREMSEVLR